jgi:hypothetical protein
MVGLLRILVLCLLFLLGVSALAGSYHLISDPSGQALQMPLELLNGTPFRNYLIPGVILLLTSGISSLIIALLTIKKAKKYSVWIVLQGVALLIWLSAELVLNKDFYTPQLHLPYYVLGALLVIFGLRILVLEKA